MSVAQKVKKFLIMFVYYKVRIIQFIILRVSPSAGVKAQRYSGIRTTTSSAEKQPEAKEMIFFKGGV
jgi:hypothetical protein